MPLPAASAAGAPVPTQTAAASTPLPVPAAVPATVPAAVAPGAAPPAAAASEQSSAEDLAPAAEPAPAAPLGAHVRRGTVDGVPLYQDWAATPGVQVPQLRLDLHVYAARPEERFVMVNMKKLREGDSVQGVHVDSITPEGAVLSYNGARFLLPRD
jgi:general secretion pathway protein B